MIRNKTSYFVIACLSALVVWGAYGVIAYRYWHNPPRPTRNITAELNAPLLKFSEDQRAWPVYRAVLTKLARLKPTEKEVGYEWHNKPLTMCDYEGIPEYIRRAEPLLAKAREAARLPSMGCLLSDGESREDVIFLARLQDDDYWRPRQEQGPITPATDNPPLWKVRYWPATELDELFDLLLAHACLAARDRDAARITSDLLATMRLANQLREVPCHYADSTSVHEFSKALRTWGYLITKSPDLFDDASLRSLEQEARSFAGGTIQLRLQSERMRFEDFVQRHYADDGRGDGYFFLAAIYTPRSWHSGPLEGFTRFAAPLTTGKYMRRNQLVSEFDRLMTIAEAEVRRPFWKCDQWQHRSAKAGGCKSGTPFSPEWELELDFAPSHARCEEATQQRDAIVAASALLRFRLKEGDWPESVSQAVPGFLAEWPVDRHTGNPLAYRRTDDGPVLYSVGPDLDDDGGRAAMLPETSYASDSRKVACPWHWRIGDYPDQKFDGDIILWPVIAAQDLAAMAPKPAKSPKNDR